MIVALAGVAGCGKDTVAAMLGAPVVRFADPFKRFCGEVFGWSDEQLNGPSHLREVPDPAWDGLTPRAALQRLGTEWGRACHPDVWARAGVRKAQQLLQRQRALNLGAVGARPATPTVVITDCRFVNEAKAVRAAGGEVWLIVRPGTGGGTHPSEREVQSAEFRELATRVIVNDGTLEQLRAKL